MIYPSVLVARSLSLSISLFPRLPSYQQLQLGLALLLDELDEILVDVGEIILAGVLVDLIAATFLAADAFLGDHDDARGALGAAGGAELSAGGDEDVGDVDVLAEDGDVADDVHGADVAGEDDDAREGGVAGAGGGRLPEGLDDFFDAALEGLVLGRCEWGDGGG